MGRKSIKEDKNYYFRLREEAGFTRAEASEVMNISEARIEKIENDRVTVVPEDIVEMSKGYKKPALCNYYCTHECRIGKDNLNIIEESSIAEISIGILDTLNTLEEKKARLVSIVADGKITDDEKIQAWEYLNSFNESLIFDESVFKLIIPNYEETRIECINPKRISDEEYIKVSELVENAQNMLSEFLNNTKNDGK